MCLGFKRDQEGKVKAFRGMPNVKQVSFGYVLGLF